MGDVTWKAFKLGDLFVTITGRDSTIAQKNLDKNSNLAEDYNVAIVTESTQNNGVGFYMKDIDPILKEKIVDKGLTFGTQFGNCNYHDYKHFIIGNTNYLRPINVNLQKLLNIQTGSFFATILNYVFKKSGLYGYGNKIDQIAFYREIISLPTVEVNKDSDYIWEENGKYWTFAVGYINILMEKAKERKEEKTIKLYEAEKAKYEAEKTKYEAQYLKEKSVVIWKGFTLENLFNFSSSNQLSLNKKGLDISPEMNDDYSIALITQSEKNNGISGYLKDEGETNLKKMYKFLTYSMHFGLCFFHDYNFVLMDTHGSVFRLLSKNDNMQKLLDLFDYTNLFLSKVITKVCRNGIYNYGWLPNSSKVGREIILLPVIEVKEENDSIWEEDGKLWTLAVHTASYLYLQGQVNIQQRKIDNYTYRH
jgi:hypothetical protein